MKHGVIHLNHSQSRLTMDRAELIGNINHTHVSMPTLNGRVV